MCMVVVVAVVWVVSVVGCTISRRCCCRCCGTSNRRSFRSKSVVIVVDVVGICTARVVQVVLILGVSRTICREM